MNNKVKQVGSRGSTTNIFSEEQNLIRSDSNNIDYLLKQNRMKELALKKATNLIELLNIELQVEKNSNQQNMKLLQEQLRSKFQKENHDLQIKIEILQRQIKRKSSNQNQNDKTARKSSMTRANTSRSVQFSKRRSITKKYTEQLSCDEIVPQFNIQISGQIYRQHAAKLEIWRSSMISQLDDIIKAEYDDLQKIINEIENLGEEYQKISDISLQKSKAKKNLNQEMLSIIRSQNGLINSLKAYSQQLEDLCKSSAIRINGLLSKNWRQDNELINKFEIQQIINTINNCLLIKKQQWRNELTNLQNENQQLKNILDSMIKLVKEQKKK